MKKIITGFKTQQDVIDILDAMNNLGWRWNSGGSHRGFKPNNFVGWKFVFSNYQKKLGGFYLDYKDGFSFGCLDDVYKSESTAEIEQVDFAKALRQMTDGPKILATLWMSNLKDGSFGIVKIDSHPEPKYYIGAVESEDDEEQDAMRIARLGCPIFPEQIKQFFNF